MTIMLIAHRRKMENMLMFCGAYASILRQHHLVATGETGRPLAQTTGLTIEQLMPVTWGAGEDALQLVRRDKVDMLFFFRDQQCGSDEMDKSEIFRICDNLAIPFASNIGTAEVLIHGLEQNALEWRDAQKL